MKKRIGIYSIIWAICLAIFNVASFVTPNESCGVSKFNGSFWVGYFFITAAFIGQLVSAVIALNEKNVNKLFYKLSLISVSYIGLIATLIVGGIFMAVKPLPYWLGIIICLIILGFTAIGVIKAGVASELVNNIDEKIKEKTIFIKALATDANTLVKCAANEDLKKEAMAVYEAIRYSDPMSCDALDGIENQIKNEFIEFNEAIHTEDIDLATEVAKGLLDLLNKRNQQCKLLK